MLYRVAFYNENGRDDDERRYDVEAKNEDDAFHKAYALCKRDLGGGPEYRYTDSSTYMIPEGPTTISLKVQYLERGKETHATHMVIYARDEEHAKEYYNANIKGKRFWQPWPRKLDEDGNCVYGKVLKTDIAGCPGYDHNALA